MRVMVFEPLGTGHRFAYLTHLLPAMDAFGVEPILVTSRQARQSAPYQTHLASLASHFEVDDSFDLPTRKYNMAVTGLFEKSLKRIRPDHCFLPVADGISQVTVARSMAGWSSFAKTIETDAVHFYGGYGYDLAKNARARWKCRANAFLLRRTPWARFFHLDNYQLQSLFRNQPDFDTRCAPMPDPVETPPTETQEEARVELGLPTDGRIIGCAGAIDARKRVDRFLRAFASVQNKLRSNDRILLAGPLDNTIKKLIETECADWVKQKRLICFDRYLSARELALSLKAMDVVVTVHPNRVGSSSIVIRAAAVGRPVLASQNYWIGRTVRQFSLGEVCNADDIDHYGSQICKVLDAAADFQTNDAAKQFVQFHSGENFAATWMSRLGERMNKKLTVQKLPWSWD